MERLAGRGEGPGVTCLRIGNIPGADGLLGRAAVGPELILDPACGLPPAPNAAGSGRVTFASALAALVGVALDGHDLPPVLNIAQDPPLPMSALLDAARLRWRFGPPRAGTIARVALATRRLDRNPARPASARHPRRAGGRVAQPVARRMTPSKRLTDIVLALVLGALLALPMLALTLILWLGQGRPVFHRSERMRTPTQSFRLCKFRTMTVAPDDSGVSGGHKDCRITPLGHLLRRTRLDEMPQLWNILRGDMSFVGPRPPLARLCRGGSPPSTAACCVSRPGLTGLATLHFHRHEARLLAACRTAAETEAVYARRCIPRKARLDLIYQRRRTLALDARLLAATAAQVLRWPRHHP